MSGIRWERQPGGSWYAFRAGVMAGMVVSRHDGRFGYVVDGINARWLTKTNGVVRSLSTGKRAVERAWQIWLERANLTPVAGGGQ